MNSRHSRNSSVPFTSNTNSWGLFTGTHAWPLRSSSDGAGRAGLLPAIVEKQNHSCPFPRLFNALDDFYRLGPAVAHVLFQLLPVCIQQNQRRITLNAELLRQRRVRFFQFV